MDEVQEYNYMNNRNCARARQLLLIIWIFVAFNLTLSFKEVLVANLVNTGYEDPINNFGDVVKSGRKLVVAKSTSIPSLLFNDQREIVKSFVSNPKNVIYFNFTGKTPPWVTKRLAKIMNCLDTFKKLR